MVGEDVYLPHVLQDVIIRVSLLTNTGIDPFTVLFRHGLFQDVSKGGV